MAVMREAFFGERLRMRDAGHQTIPKEATLSRRSLWPLVSLLFSRRVHTMRFNSAAISASGINSLNRCSMSMR